MNSVHRQVGAVMESALGRVLVGVDYMCFPYEVSDALSAMELDGEIALHFEGDVAVRLTWCQADGWGEVNSLMASAETQYRPGALSPVTARSHELWAPHIGSELRRVDVLGWLETPAVARLTFASGSVLVGVGGKSGFRDGDSILVRADDAMWIQSEVEATTLWVSSNDA